MFETFTDKKIIITTILPEKVFIGKVLEEKEHYVIFAQDILSGRGKNILIQKKFVLCVEEFSFAEDDFKPVEILDVLGS